jgi:hypothetical protein
LLVVLVGLLVPVAPCTDVWIQPNDEKFWCVGVVEKKPVAKK